jgi:hypothetical protein
MRGVDFGKLVVGLETERRSVAGSGVVVVWEH